MTQRRFLTRGKAAIAAVLVSATMFGSVPAMAGPGTGLASATLTAMVDPPICPPTPPPWV